MRRFHALPKSLIFTLLLIKLCHAVEAQQSEGSVVLPSTQAVVLFSAPPIGENYQLRVGDCLALRVFQHADSSPEKCVDDRGMIRLPSGEEINVAGFTLIGVRDEVVNRYKKYERDPQVFIRFSKYKAEPVKVYGLYSKTFISPMRFDEAKLTLEISSVGADEVELTFYPSYDGPSWKSGLTAWLDGTENLTLASAAQVSQGIFILHGESEYVRLKIGIDALAHLAKSREVKMKLGEREFKFKENDLEAIRFLANYIPTLAAP